MITEDRAEQVYKHLGDAIQAYTKTRQKELQARQAYEVAEQKIIGQGVEGKNVEERKAAVYNALIKDRKKLHFAENENLAAEGEFSRWKNEARSIDVRNTIQKLENEVMNFTMGQVGNVLG